MQRPLQIPLLGSMTEQQFREALTKSIVDEATAADFYTRLISRAPDDLARDYISHARDEELFHLQNFENLYRQYFGSKPQYTIVPTPFSDYKQGVLTAMNGEMEAIDFYRNIQLSVRDPIIRDSFYLPMVDELVHLTLFSTLYNRS